MNNRTVWHLTADSVLELRDIQKQIQEQLDKLREINDMNVVFNQDSQLNRELFHQHVSERLLHEHEFALSSSALIDDEERDKVYSAR
ncbi:hypothetical protein [Vibrio parahaemolyticus]|uniref:hypothetical protein n=1 Tax=Vibrio parahaemolyticus TaxID=670 RepID=UPI000344DDD4|nr:hypothetical protein [Vibrio parahaemolyticus]MDF5407178.1 hypothetical protein [Vibrio parahaemolyticus]MDG2822611.1 hypothetical protein [Vibrio parahaemolyticus]MDG2843402.1 hypothetical protein [Vibrio parahaemolyticus]MDG2858437.1 hypothetical protein [Vibrio parahaemolyticus]MDG2864322.1 hypothetical protein [Vibrio parahaemolyticus]